MLPVREGAIPGAQGIQIFWRSWDAPKARGCLLLLHGLGEHSGRYDAFCRALAAAGLRVFAFDLRGHGRSQGSRGDVGAFPHFLQDLLAMEELLDREIPGRLPRFLFGHSMGGLLGLRRLQVFRSPYTGAIFSAPWLATAHPDWVQRVMAFLGLALPGIPLPSGIGPRKLTRDPGMVYSWQQDPLIHSRVTPRLFREVVRVQKEVLGFRGAVEIPLLFLIPGRDPVVRSEVTEDFARGVVGGAAQVEILPGRLHEPLNDLGREEVWALVTDWLEARMDAPPMESRGG